VTSDHGFSFAPSHVGCLTSMENDWAVRIPLCDIRVPGGRVYEEYCLVERGGSAVWWIHGILEDLLYPLGHAVA
jgi:hypothetical protein